MATFGSFETDREIYSGSSYSVYSAKKSGDLKTEYAVKVFFVRRSGLDPESVTELDRLFSDIEQACVARVSVQQTAAAASKNVSIIYETGSDERGVWYVTKFYPRSVNKIISGRVALGRDAVEFIIRSMAQGAIDIKQTCGRSHGDIRPSNVQISRSEKMVEAEVVLSDPLPGNETESGRYELSDLRSIGRILLQLVLQREIEQEEVLILPILLSPEWKRIFGKDSERWLSLCNRLLDPELSLEHLTLDQLGLELDQLRHKPAVSPRVLVVLATLVVLIAVLAVFVTMHLKRGQILITTDPTGVEIKIEVKGEYQSFGKTQADGKPLSVKRLPKGTYKLRAEYPGLPEQIGEVTVESGKTRSFEFVFPYGQVRITSTPANAAVELDGKTVGTTPYTSPLLGDGQQTYFLRLTNYEPAKVTVVVSTNRQVMHVDRNLDQMKVDDGLVEFSSMPGGAIIREGTEVFGDTPMFKKLSAGRHTITAQFQDWPPVSREVVVRAGQNPPVDFRFSYGIAIFEVVPEGAKILVNNVPVTNRPPRKFFQPGIHTVLVTNSGYHSVSTNITITDGSNPVKLSVSLKPMHGIVTFTTEPPGATIYEARAPDRKLGVTPLSTNFPPGPYSFIARYEGLDEIRSRPVNVSDGKTFPVELKFSFGTVQFTTVPEGADVLIGNTIKGKTPYSYFQKPGQVAYRVELPDYDPVTGNADLSAGGIIPLPFDLSRRKVGLKLQSDPPGAQYYLANTLLQGADGRYLLPWGTNTITARYPGPAGLPELEEKTVSIPVDKTGVSAMKFDFTYGTLEITNAEPEAVLIYEGRTVTNFPTRLYLKPGSYKFEVGYGEDFRTNLPVTLAANGSYTPRIALPELRRVYTNSIGMVLIRVSKNLYVGKFEVTEAEYQSVTGRAARTPRLPVVIVKWDEALAYCQALTQKDEAMLARSRMQGWSYSLPRQAEWEQFVERDPEQLVGAVFGRLEGRLEIDPLRKSSNRAGLFDLFGNVAEWCYDGNNQPMTIGGSHNRPRPRQFPADFMRINDAGQLGTSIADGSPTIGFRCVLRASQ